MSRHQIALTIAGSDPSGGAGIQADLKTFHQFGVYGEAILTLLTVQNTVTVSRVEVLSPELILAQLQAVVEDIPPAAAKTGALGNADVVEALAGVLRQCSFPVVVDPVMLSKHGAPLIHETACLALRKYLLPCAQLVTPNLHEAGALTGIEVNTLDSMKEAARRLSGETGASILVKGGHLTQSATDILFHADLFHEFPGSRIDTPHTHGTGCTYSAAITAGLACGFPLVESIRRAKRFITEAIRTNPGLGHGNGPVNHHAPVI